MFSQHIQQAHQGCDFDYLETSFGAPTGEPGARALIQYAVDGTRSEELEDVLPEMLAAADFVHSRAMQAGSAEQRTLRARAAREDVLRGPVSVAMATWSP